MEKGHLHTEFVLPEETLTSCGIRKSMPPAAKASLFGPPLFRIPTLDLQENRNGKKGFFLTFSQKDSARRATVTVKQTHSDSRSGNARGQPPLHPAHAGASTAYSEPHSRSYRRPSLSRLSFPILHGKTGRLAIPDNNTGREGARISGRKGKEISGTVWEIHFSP